MNQHHLHLSENFKLHYKGDYITFEKQKTILLKKAQGGKIRVDVAIDEVSGEKVGYCVSPVSISRVGEIESIYVEVNYRGRGIGDTLIRKGIGWMDAKFAESKIVEVCAGNEDGFGFYVRCGFVPMKIVLKQARYI